MSWVIWVVSFTLNISWAQPSCTDIFMSPQSTQLVASSIPDVFIKQANRLLPQSDFSNRSLEEFYFEVLSTFERVTAAHELAPEFSKFLVTANNKHYEMPQSPKELRQFYLNALQALYSRAAWEWKRRHIENLAGHTVSGLELYAAQNLMESFFSYAGMGSSMTRATAIREVLEKKEWELYPFAQAMEIVRAWEKSEEFHRGFYGFHKWLDKQSTLPQLTHPQLERLYLALTKVDRNSGPVFCCKAVNACGACPHNRKWLKDK